MNGAVLRVAVVSLLVASAAVPATAASAEPDSADGFLEAFRSMQNDAAFDRYSEFELIRSQGIVAVQVRDASPAEIRRMSLLLDALQNFSDAYRLSREEAYVDSLAAANRTRRALERLESAGGSQYSDIAFVGLERFYRSLGENLAERAKEQGNSREEIALFRNAAAAHQLGGNSERYADLLARADRLESTFRRDVEMMNASATAASRFLSSCGSECVNPISAARQHRFAVFDLYERARALNRRVDAAATLASDHGVDGREESLRRLSGELSSSLLALALASGLFGVGYVLVIGVPAMLIAIRFGSWRRDLADARVGRVLSSTPVTGGRDRASE
jgi:hypothetical protein